MEDRRDRILANAPTWLGAEGSHSGECAYFVCCGLGWVFVVRCLMSDGPKGKWGAWLSWGFGGLVAVYFGFPAVWIWPIWKVFASGLPVWTAYLFQPIRSLTVISPWYRDWVEWGMFFLGVPGEFLY